MLKIDTIYKKGVLFIRPYGVINKVTRLELDKVLESVIDKAGVKYLLINFDNIYYINTDITKMLDNWSKKINENNGRFFICCYEKINNKYLVNINDSICGMNDEFSVFNVVNI